MPLRLCRQEGRTSQGARAQARHNLLNAFVYQLASERRMRTGCGVAENRRCALFVAPCVEQQKTWARQVL